MTGSREAEGDVCSAKKHEIILVAGIPGTGKSIFCAWLAREKGFIHLEFDDLLEGKGSSENLSLIAVLKSTGPRSFMDALKRSGRRTAIEWGFHPADLPRVRELISAGAEGWWFDGDRAAAREAYKEAKGAAHFPAFDQQLTRVEGAWDEISKLFRSRILRVVGPGPSHVPVEQTWRKMRGQKAK
jgi:hypothetical protein